MDKIADNELQMILTWTDGEYNQDTLVEATQEGIDLGWVGLISWEWIDKARAKLESK